MSRELWIVTGLSGAGKSLTLKSLEDLGFECVDNLPCALTHPYIEYEVAQDSKQPSWRALGMRGVEQLRELEDSLQKLPEQSFVVRLFFLECDDATLVKRYSESRRRHPLVAEGMGLLRAIRREREVLQALREQADYVIDTSTLSPHTLMTRLEAIQAVHSGRSQPLLVHLQSFGFKNGAPSDAEWIWDMRFLPNPYYDLDLRERSGVESEVSTVVFSEPELCDWVDLQIEHFMKVLPVYGKQGRRQVNLAVGCTGGQHRSVAVVERLGQRCKKEGYVVSIQHRDTTLRPELEGERFRVLDSETMSNRSTPVSTL